MVKISLRSLEKSNPKAYWELLNNKSCQKKTTINVSLVDLLDHFQSLGNTHRPEVQTVRQLDSVLKTENYCLTPITMDERDLMIDKLKNAKACGNDLIRNEFLKSCPVELRRIIVDLFNVVLDSGIVPTEWCI